MLYNVIVNRHDMCINISDNITVIFFNVRGWYFSKYKSREHGMNVGWEWRKKYPYKTKNYQLPEE